MSIIQITKNRDRKDYSFANINLLGKCNAKCFFCLGEDISELLSKHNQIGIPFAEWKNFERFLIACEAQGVKKLYITGQNVDSLQYKYFNELVESLKQRGFTVGIRTNGYLAERKLDGIQLCDDEIGYSIHSLNPDTNYKIMGHKTLPDWESIIPASGDNVRVAIVLNRYNYNEFFDILKYVSKFPNVRYIQVRRISTDTRYEMFREDIELYEKMYQQVLLSYPQIGQFHLAQQFEIFGKEVNFWRTVETSVNSLNYFTDGTISDNYFIVEGYLQNYTG